MAFPTTSVLDDFNTGALQNLTARAGWGATVLWSGEPTMATNATPDAVVVAGAVAFLSNYWNTSFSDAEVWVTVKTVGSGATDLMILSTRAASPNTGAVSEYAFQVSHGTGAWQLYWYLAGVFQGALASGTIGAIGVGDSYGMSSVGTLHTAYYKSAAGAWTTLGSATEATLASGFLGLEGRFTTTSAQLTDFGGGAPVSAPTTPRNVSGWITRSGGY